jgi:hypothetical protein
VYFLGEVEHSRVTGQRFLPLVVVIAETYSHLVGDGPFLDSADKEICALFQDET